MTPAYTGRERLWIGQGSAPLSRTALGTAMAMPVPSMMTWCQIWILMG
jgi:hypothetical protein